MKLNLSKLNRAISRAWDGTIDAYAEQCQEELTAEKWTWNGTTKRRNGETVGTPRDRRDEDELFDSQTIVQVDEETAIVGYTAAHAAIVHEGYAADETIYPGTPWLRTALEELPLDRVMSDKLRRELK
ncbi:hypothetical protein H6F43_00485 [Leptolyngbya sp. FACHB-36]|uniref:hypothetical protein n=1 Tax=Leptolyngbya sp. FACHB-36 TaxID=2692808 RepID=UPI00168090C0|nr:hypothetical protein [Leptolyngbya sp. FACHB-36]MBD2018660.1 hypothetical protein [Leptolyngbya sp. FACHB-36]